MLESVYVRCTHCGYDNSPEYRFCGMCGASLAHPPAAIAAATKEPLRTESAGGIAPAGNGNGTETVHGPSFLGLAQDPKTEFHYLYEDEPPRSYAGVVFGLILLIGIGGFGYWQWKHNGYPFNRLNLENKPAQTASPSEVAPAPSQEPQTNAQKPMTGAGDVLPTAPDQNAKPPETGKPAESQAQGGQTPPAAKGEEGKAAAGAGAAGATSEEKTTEETEEAKATPPAEAAAGAASGKTRTKTPAPKTPAPKAKAPVAGATTPAAAASPDADLELAGERYLYGNGLPQNCQRAESSLRTAATHGNSKAQTVLGTMYATGHCVGRDLPTAYRWFARALHQEPQNSRISADLQVLWRQMTPQEKQLATSSGQ